MSDESLTVERTRFAGPPPPDPLDPAATTLQDPPAADPTPEELPPPAGRRWLPGRGRAAAGTSTSTRSSDGPPDVGGPRRAEIAGEMATALVGLASLAALAARFLLRGRGVEVLRPTEAEQRKMAAPLGRIGARHVPIELAPAVVKDLFDVGAFGDALADYLDGAARRRRGGELPQPDPIPEEIP